MNQRTQANGNGSRRISFFSVVAAVFLVGLVPAQAQSPDIRAAYDALTKEATDRGVFGAPTYVYKEELFWGQDRLDFLDRALQAKG